MGTIDLVKRFLVRENSFPTEDEYTALAEMNNIIRELKSITKSNDYSKVIFKWLDEKESLEIEKQNLLAKL